MNDRPPINLIYIASIGRSGSTLLESMLGAHSEIATMGEVHIWPHEIGQGGVQPCACGNHVQHCPFWIEMRRRVDPLKQEGPTLHFFREKHNAGRTLRRNRLKAFGPHPTETLTESADIMAYGRNNQAVFQAFLDVTAAMLDGQPRWIVDASKDPYRLLWLLRSGLFNVKVIHLVKNPRGFVYSVTKPYLRKQGLAAGARRLYYTARQSTAWVIQNHLVSKIAQHHLDPTDYLLVNYETLAADPVATFASVCDGIGCGVEPEAVDNFRAGALHTIAGNPMRYQNTSIRLDEQWKTQLPYSSRKLAEAITGFSMARYGYR